MPEKQVERIVVTKQADGVSASVEADVVTAIALLAVAAKAISRIAGIAPQQVLETAKHTLEATQKD